MKKHDLEIPHQIIFWFGEYCATSFFSTTTLKHLLAFLAGHGKHRSGNGGSSEQLPAVPASEQGCMDFRFKADEHAESRFTVSRSMYFLDNLESLKLLCRSRLGTSQNSLELVTNSKPGSNITIQRILRRLSTVQVTMLLNI